ncbi:hypothetical protein INT47_006194 [Mucor saturninus]|uniref:Uncharacterized protein n=1 Tax=Mucor saturninus TaxID=64648 RepID=A0A8H7RCV9_9FUNG|nr:hypothetical protein INT47_006194 [Mucor saturninus]
MSLNISKAPKKQKRELYMFLTDKNTKKHEEEELKQKEELLRQLLGSSDDDDDELNHKKSFRFDDNDCDMNSYSGAGDNDHGAWNNHEKLSCTQPVPVSEAATIQPVTSQSVTSQSVTSQPVTSQPVSTESVSTEPVVNLTQHRIKLQKLSAAWKDLMKVFPNAYLAFLGRNGGLPNMLDGQGSLRGPSCGCPDDYMRLAKVNFFFVWGSAEKISNFYGAWATVTEKATISEEKCSNTIILYHKMVELSEQMVLGEVFTSCPACPEGTSTTATKDVTTAKSPTTKKSTVEQPRIFQALMHQNRTSAIYPVRGVFGNGCARHDTVFQLADTNAGEGFKCPLVAIAFVENQLGRKVPLHVMYDIVCKLEPSINVCYI